MKKAGLPKPIRTRLEPGPTLFDIFRTTRKISTYSYRDRDGKTREHSVSGPLAYFLDVPAFRSFVAAYRKANQTAAEIQHAIRLGNKSVLEGPVPEELVAFNSKYGLLLDNLVHVVDLPGRRVPFVNAFYFPRSAKHMRHFWDFLDALGEAYNLQRGETAGRPPGKSKYSLNQLSQYEKSLPKKGSARAMELAFPDEFVNDSGDPFKKLKPALSRLRKKKSSSRRR